MHANAGDGGMGEEAREGKRENSETFPCSSSHFLILYVFWFISQKLPKPVPSLDGTRRNTLKRYNHNFEWPNHAYTIVFRNMPINKAHRYCSELEKQ